ncbi:zinc-binding dehydrogenase [Nocardia sp. NPDC046763]|uniref:zinc-binding dehydrogenase n=1 Tax=Nocardia sp. NPDC046763 TaxID=3155256 RepID=UPI0033D7B522
MLSSNRPLNATRPCSSATHGGFEYLTQALEFVATGTVTPMVETYPLANAADAYERVASGAVRSRAVITY